MKVKKLLSTFAALAIAASSFAGLGINASAALVPIVNDDFNSTEQAASAATLSTNTMNWTVTNGGVAVREINSNGYSGTADAYQYPMPLARSNQGNFYSKDGGFMYITADVTAGITATAEGKIANAENKVTNGSVSFDFAFPATQVTNNRVRNNATQSLAITDGTNTIAKIEVTSYVESTSATGAYDNSPATVKIGDGVAGSGNYVEYTSTDKATTVGWYSFSMTVDDTTNKANISVTTPAKTTLTKEYTITNTGINTLSWSGSVPDTNNVANIALDNIKFEQEMDATPVLTTINVSGDSEIKYSEGATIQLSSETLDQFGSNIEADVTWSSNDEEIATVSNTGLVTLADKTGDVTITAQSGEVKGTHTIKVLEAPKITTAAVAGASTVEFVSGRKLAYLASAVDQYNLPIAATFTWTGNNDGVAAIDATTGAVELKKAGEVTFTATASGTDVTATKKLTVTEAPALTTPSKTLTEDFADFADGQLLSQQPNAEAVIPTTKNNITYTQGGAANDRNNSNTFIKAVGGAMQVNLGSFSSNNRNPRMTFNSVPKLSEITAEADTTAAEVLTFDATFAGNEKLVISDGTNAVAAIEKTANGILLNGESTGMSGALGVKVVLTSGSAYTELTSGDTVYASKLETTANALSTIVFGGTTNNIGLFVTMDNIKITASAPSISVFTAAPADLGATVATEGTVKAKAVDGGKLAEAEEDVTIDGVKAVYIKVENAEDDVMPAVEVGNEKYAPSYTYSVNGNGYFVYQFVNIKLDNAKVTYTGAEEKALPTE